MKYFSDWPYVLENWFKLVLTLVLVALLPGWWALLPLLIMLTLK